MENLEGKRKPANDNKSEARQMLEALGKNDMYAGKEGDDELQNLPHDFEEK